MKVLSSVMSTPAQPSVPGGAHSNSCTRAAKKHLMFIMARPTPGQNLCPAPNGIILISLVPGKGPTSSASPPGRNRSGRNSSGSIHVLPSLPMSPTVNCAMKSPLVFPRTPSTSAASAWTWRWTKGTCGCKRRVSSTTAFRYGMPRMRLLLELAATAPPAPSTSSRSFFWISWSFTRWARVHSMLAITVPVPAPRNSDSRFTNSSSLTARRPAPSPLPPSGTRRSMSESTYGRRPPPSHVGRDSRRASTRGRYNSPNRPCMAKSRRSRLHSASLANMVPGEARASPTATCWNSRIRQPMTRTCPSSTSSPKHRRASSEKMEG
uniref:Uncharacterized protein n=1 Tax=Triticum urartu TaxID=4572 RepID=A0A8R7RGD9_TRIUA